MNDPVELWDVKLKNQSGRKRKLSDEDGIIEHDLFYEEFGYQYHTEDNLVAVERGEMSGSFEKGGNHCGALKKCLELEPGEESGIFPVS